MEDNRINIFSKNYVINTLKKIGANPLKRLGQNFLIDKNVINNIKSLIPNSYTLIEIGPGLGHMRLVYPENNHIGIEIDKKLAAFLQSEGFNVINDDFLNIDLKNIIKDKTLIFGNLPYYITTEIILHIIRNISKYIVKVIVLVQKEFARKLKNNEIKTPSLILIRHYFDISLLFDVSRNSFYPAPNVDSTLVVLENKGLEYDKNFENFLKNIFTHKRKNVNKIFDKKFLEDFNIDSNKRIEEIDDIYNLYCNFEKYQT